MKFFAVLRPTIQKINASTCINPLSFQVVENTGDFMAVKEPKTMMIFRVNNEIMRHHLKYNNSNESGKCPSARGPTTS